MRLSFKDYRDIYEVGDLNPILYDVLDFCIEYANTELDVDLEVTSIWRPASGVHTLYRAIDIVPTDRSVAKMEKIRDAVNEAYDYGKDEFEICPPVRHGSAPHCHLQVRPEMPGTAGGIVTYRSRCTGWTRRWAYARRSCRCWFSGRGPPAR